MKQKNECACAVPDCKGMPSFGPILMPQDLTFKEAYLCAIERLGKHLGHGWWLLFEVGVQNLELGGDGATTFSGHPTSSAS